MNVYILNHNVSEYFGFAKNNSQKILVSSICADYVRSTYEKKRFRCLVNNEIKNLLKTDALKNYKAYAIFNKAFYSLPTRIEMYKKIWKDPMIKPYADLLETKEEIITKHNGFYLFSGISRLISLDQIDLFFILDMLGFYNLLFLSRQDLIDIYKELNSIQKITFLGSVKTPKINFYALLKEYCNDGNVMIRFGTDFTNMEVSIFFNYEDFPNNLNFGYF